MSYDYQRTAAATPLPSSFPASEIGLMTLDEFLRFRNPGEKHHPSDAYEIGLMRLNEDYGAVIGRSGRTGEEIVVTKRSAGYEMTMEGKLIAIVHGDTAYYESPRVKNKIPKGVYELRGAGDKYVDLGIAKLERVKYLSEVAPRISPIARKNEEEYPVLLQHFIVKGEPMTLRAEKFPALNKRVSLAIMNANGFRVAAATDEWGATLLRVVQEYQGRGLGKLLGQYWYEYNPDSQSGGFTSSGERNAVSLWKERVREFGARGWYTQLIKEGRLTKDRLRDILKDVGSRPPPKPPAEPAGAQATGKKLVFADDVTFVVYDAAFLDEPDERFIHGYGFFRDNNRGTFLYRIEYDRPYEKLVTSVALQMAKDNGDTLYDGAEDGISDLLEGVDSVPGVEREGDYLTVTRDLLPLKSLAQVERLTRKKVDPHQEKYHQLLEMAEGKWS